jgi:hypothetical protein
MEPYDATLVVPSVNHFIHWDTVLGELELIISLEFFDIVFNRDFLYVSLVHNQFLEQGKTHGPRHMTASVQL